MLAAVFVALALPLAAVIGFAVATFKARQPAVSVEISPEATAALQRSLEDAAGKNLAPAGLDGESAVEISTDDISSKMEKVTKLAGDLGGSAMSMDGGRIWAQIPGNHVSFFKKACVSGQDIALPEKGVDASLVLVEVVIRKPEAP